MKKRIFALALALCMMLAAAPIALATGVLTLGNNTNSGPSLTQDTSDSGIVPFNFGSGAGSGVFNLARDGGAYSYDGITLPPNPKGVELSKSVEKTSNGIYHVALESFVTADYKITTEKEKIPADITLVLDISESMNEYIKVGSKYERGDLDTDYGATAGVYRIDRCAMRYSNESNEWQYYGVDGFGWPPPMAWKTLSRAWFGEGIIYIHKIDAMKIAALKFVDTVLGKVNEDGIDHTITIISCNDDALTALEKTSVNNKNEATIKSTIKKLGTSQSESFLGISLDKYFGSNSTDLNTALSSAKTAIGPTPDENRSRVVVVISDGKPTNTADTTFDITKANAAIATSKAIKALDKTYVYTVGVFAEANTLGTSNENLFLQYLSSNYKNATAMDNAGTSTGTTYYKAAPTSLDTNAAFEKIFEEVDMENTTGGVDYNLDAGTVLTDTLTTYFKVERTTIKTYTAKYKAHPKTGREFYEKVEVNNLTIGGDESSVTVSGFDYTKNAVTDTNNNGHMSYSGCKLIVEFDIVPKAGFLGGKGVPTNNLLASNIIEDDLVVAYFPKPELVDVDVVAPTPSVNDKTIYLSGSVADAANLYTPKTYTWEDDYVDITYMVTEGGSEKTGALSPTVCTDYTVTCIVDGDGSGTDDAYNKTESATATVHVTKPVVSNADAVIYVGNKIDLTSCMSEGDNWVCQHTGTEQKTLPAYDVNGTTRTRISNVPALTHTFNGSSVSSVTLDSCTLYDVVTTVNGKPVTPYENDSTFKVHVLQPSFSGIDKTIYLGNSTNLEKTDVNWACQCEGTDKKTEATEQGSKQNESYGFGISGDVKPADCSKYTLTYSVNDKTFTDDTWIHVRKPKFTIGDAATFLGNTVTVNDLLQDAVDWENGCTHDDITHNYVGKAPDSKAISFVVNGEGTITPSDCKDYTANIIINGTNYASETDTFTIHVVKPVVTAEDAVIKLGVEAPKTGQIAWNQKTSMFRATKYICDCDSDNEHTDMYGTMFELALNYTGEQYPTSCVVNGHRAIAVVKLDSSNPNTYRDIYAEYTVHVQTPVVTGTDDTIYQGADYDLASTVTWNNCDHNKELTDDSDPDSQTTYTNGATKANSETCTTYTVSYKLEKLPTLPAFTDDFTVHVLVPKFALATQDLWADLNTTVDLYTVSSTDADVVRSWNHSWVYSGSCESHSEELPSNAPDVTVTNVLFNDAETAKITAADTAVTVNKVSYSLTNNATGTAEGARIEAAEGGSLTAKLHANTFVLKVVNTSAQNGIFTLKQGENPLYKVAIPGNTDTTKISGLYCTLLYNLDETNGNGWSWRYDDAVVTTGITHSNPNVVATSNCGYEVTVTVSYGTQTNTKWLSGEAYKINNESTICTVENVTLAVKKEEEGEENA